MNMRSSGGTKAAGWFMAGSLLLMLSFVTRAGAAEKGQWVRLAPKTPKQPDATDLSKVSLPLGCPTAVRGVLAVDRCSGDLFISACYYGLWKSKDHGQTFERVDNGQIHDGTPFREYALQINPEDGKKIALFNANANPYSYSYSFAFRSQKGLIPTATCGFSTDGGITWQIFAPVNVPEHTDTVDLIFDRVYALDWKSSALLAVHRSRLFYNPNGGKTWQVLPSNGVRHDYGVGIFDPSTLVISKSGIERSEDAGKTWTKVSEYTGIGPLQFFKGTAYWPTTKGEIVTSKDAGKTWTPLPKTPKYVVADDSIYYHACGPYFGKDENHMVVMGPDGFWETTDGGQNWKLAAPPAPTYADAVPRGINVPSAAFDPVGNIFYYLPTHGYLEDIWKFER